MRKKIAETPGNVAPCAHKSAGGQDCRGIEPPGLATFGCAYEGAYFALAPVSDAVHLVHGPMTCLGSTWEFRHVGSSCAGLDKTQVGFTTDIGEMELVHGGEKKLAGAIDYAISKYQPQGVFVYETCVTALIGDDMDSVCGAAERRWNIPVVPVHAPGFIGTKNYGERLGLEAVVNHIVGTKEPEFATPYDINLIGEHNINGEMWMYKPILQEIGVRILSTFSGDGRIEKMRQAHRARLNVVVCAKSSLAIAEIMKKRWGIPYLSASFYGMREASDAIRRICRQLGDAKLIKKAEQVIAREEAKVNKALEPYRELFAGRKAVLNTGGNKSWAFAVALQDIGIEVVGVSVRKSNEEDRAKLRNILGADAVLMEKPVVEQIPLIMRTGADLLLAGGRSLYSALKKAIPFIEVSQEKTGNYCGYGGLINLARDIDLSINNPVFKLVSGDAPWEKKVMEPEQCLGRGA
ncbi:nitrogenase FeMo-cofactor scaffold and assembly protein NifE [Desulfocucumis palustris]|uniref:Nitrogenase FeMo-cofactor scaffold and assembly protein NifE n=1 Tax=Desulfocucumis palustris TaxID=1898651 RepID=A0A2L2XFZ8_9FIRM|nr:nitrogenase component 1 [Desulfocucumis palustris]GBF35168.1 nitrogenase FeMo-cofactor scaffold and assembly protein NifE [Desulfocucumis palustris]